MLKYPQFYRKYGVYNSSGFKTIITHREGQLTELPMDSRLHIFDSVYNYTKNYTVAFDMNQPYFGKKKFGVYNIHNTSAGIIPKDTKLQFPTKDLKLKTLEFANTNKSRFITIPDDRKIDSTMPMNLVVINYNALSRVRLMGKFIEQRLVELFLTEAVNRINKYNGNHFVYVPLDTMTFVQQDFTRTYKAFVPVSFKYTTNVQYILTVHILNLLNIDSINGTLSKLPPHKYDSVTFIFNVGDKYVYYNLGEIFKLNEKNKAFLQIQRQFNDLSVAGRPTATKDLTAIDPEKNIDARSCDVLVDALSDSKTEVTPTIIDSVAEVDLAGEIAIERSKERLTTKQYAKLKKISVKYKDVVLEKGSGETLEAILNTPIEQTNTLDIANLDYLKDVVPDQSMLSTSILTSRIQYMQKAFKKDLAGTLTDFSKNGLFLVGIEKNEARTELSRIDHYSVTYVNERQEQTTIKFHLPHVDKDGDILVNGIKMRLRYQNITKPICKISKDTVSLSSNNNKALVQRHRTKATTFNEHLLKHIVKRGEDKINLIYGVVAPIGDVRAKLPYEYTSLSEKITQMQIKDPKMGSAEIEFNFEYTDRLHGLTDKTSKFVEKFEEDNNTVYLGGNTTTLFFIEIQGKLSIIDVKTLAVIPNSPDTLLDYIYGVVGPPSKPLANWVDLRILSKDFPMIFILGYRFGLSKILKYLNIDYAEFPKGVRVVAKDRSDVIIAFQDKSIVFKRSPLAKSLFSNGLRWMDLRKYYFEDMDDPQKYINILLDKKIGPHYLRGISNFFEMFLDYKTKEVLSQMGEPTNMLDLLVRATTMLVDQQHLPPASVENFRTRTYEKFIDVIYNEMSRALGQQKYAGHLSKEKFTINPNAVFNSVMSDTLMDNVSTINPIHQVKMDSAFSYTGIGGRDQQSFVHRDRQFPEDGVGVISEATVDSGRVALNSCFSQNPSITNNNGIIKPVDLDEVEPGQMLSVTGLLMPGVTSDDGKRANFVNGQFSQFVATEDSDICKVRTGYDKVIASLSRYPFAVVAKQPGVVVDVNEKLKMFKIQYKDGTVRSYEYGAIPTMVTGVSVTQNIDCIVKKGQKFQRGDTLCYNRDYFKLTSDGIPTFKMGVLMNIAFIENDNTIEDSSGVSKRAASRMGYEPVHRRSISIHKDSIVFDIVKLGQAVLNTHNLLIFDDGDIPQMFLKNEYIDEISELNRSTPKCKFSGKILRINVVYNCELSDMSESLRAVVKEITRPQNSKANFSNDPDEGFVKSKPLIGENKLGKVTVDEDSVVFDFYIQEKDSLDAGDKIFIASSLKSVISEIFEEPIIASDLKDVDTGKPLEIDCLFSQTSVSNRIVTSPMILGLGTRWCDALEKKLLDIWEA